MLNVSRLSDLKRSESGVSAIEFGLLAPLLVLLFMGTIEFPRFFSTDQSVSRSTRAMANLLSFGAPANLNDLYSAGQVVSDPYDISAAGIVLTTVGVYRQNGVIKAKVCSSAAKNTSPRAVGEYLTTPASEYIEKGRYIMVELGIKYNPMFKFFPFLNNYNLKQSVNWPVRDGSTVNGDPEIVLPGGQPCPIT